MSRNESSLAELQEELSDQRKSVETKLHNLEGVGEAVQKDVKEMREYQWILEDIISKRLANTMGLCDEMVLSYGNQFQPQVTPIKNVF